MDFVCLEGKRSGTEQRPSAQSWLWYLGSWVLYAVLVLPAEQPARSDSHPPRGHLSRCAGDDLQGKGCQCALEQGKCLQLWALSFQPFQMNLVVFFSYASAQAALCLSDQL